MRSINWQQQQQRRHRTCALHELRRLPATGFSTWCDSISTTSRADGRSPGSACKARRLIQGPPDM